MADTKLSALTELNAAPASTDELYINDGGVSKKITVANLLSFILAQAQTFTAMQGMSFTTLADGSTAWDMAATTNNIVITLDENTTLGFPTNLRAGSGIIKIIQGATKRTFDFHASYLFAGGTAPTITDANNAVDWLAWTCDGTTVVIGAFAQAVAAAS